MTALPKDPIYELKAVLSEHLPWHGARIGFLAQFLLALLKVRSVNLAELATGFGGMAKVDSHYKRLQRFFRSFDIDYDDLARLLVRLIPLNDGPWRLTMDRTNWQFGKADINFLVLGIYEKLDVLSVSNVPSLVEIGYKFDEEAFVVNAKNGNIRTEKAESISRNFIQDVVYKHFSG